MQYKWKCKKCSMKEVIQCQMCGKRFAGLLYLKKYNKIPQCFDRRQWICKLCSLYGTTMENHVQGRTETGAYIHQAENPIYSRLRSEGKDNPMEGIFPNHRYAYTRCRIRKMKNLQSSPLCTIQEVNECD